jgi:tRNA(Arg) A34 adenosine deaminase TadA
MMLSIKDAKLPQPGEWSHCVIYSSAEPCSMWLSAIYWAGIKDLAFAATRFDAAAKRLISLTISISSGFFLNFKVLLSNNHGGFC